MQQSETSQRSDSTTAWVDVGSAADYPPGEQVCTTAADRPIVVFNVDGEMYAIANVCPHAGLPIGDGERRGMVITCPYHGYTYRIDRGHNIDWPHDEPPVKTYPVRVAEQRVQVQMPASVAAQKRKKDADQAPRGPAPAESPADEPQPCEPDAPNKPGPHDPDCPEGYPDRRSDPGKTE